MANLLVSMQKSLLVNKFLFLTLVLVVCVQPIDAQVSEDFFTTGNFKLEQKDYKGAIRDYTKAVLTEPNNPDIYFNRAYAKSMLADYVGAVQDYSKAIAIFPTMPNAYYNRGIEKGHMKDYRGAVQDHTIALEQDRNNADIYLTVDWQKCHE
jgi:tetratricopeptide (TPR) repeat protein